MIIILLLLGICSGLENINSHGAIKNSDTLEAQQINAAAIK
jgi:F0F1-type ATP synthase assembly protein I